MVATLGGVVKIILLLLFFSGLVRFFIRLTATYAVNKVNQEVNKSKNNSQNKKEASKSASAQRVPDSEYVDFVEIKDQDGNE